MFSARKRTGRAVPSKAEKHAPRISSGLSTTAMVGCLIVLCGAAIYACWSADALPALTRTNVESDSKELQSAIDAAMSKDRRELGPAMRFLQKSFDAMPKDEVGNVNARSASYLLQTYFASHGWRINGLSHSVMQRPSSKSLHEALHNVAALKNSAPAIHEALRRRAADRAGFTLKHIAGLAAVIRGKLLSDGHVSTILRMLYRRRNLTFADKIGKDMLENITKAFISQSNVVDAFADPLLPAFNNTADMALLESGALEHANALLARSTGKSSSNSTNNSISHNFSSQVVLAMAENLTLNFEKLYHTQHCEQVTRLLIQSAPKDTGRLRLSTFYSQTWNGSLNFKEPRRHLQTAGALDVSDDKTDSTRVLIANYVQGQLNCIRHSQYYSICCPNPCVGIMQSLESTLRSPAVAPEMILSAIANLSSLSTEFARQAPTPLAAKLNEISHIHGGVVPLHGRLFSQWLHFVFPNQCPHPIEGHVENRKTRLIPKDRTRKEEDEIQWAMLKKGFDIPATRLHTIAWSKSEVLPLQEKQVWNEYSMWRDFPRVAMLGLALVMMLQMMYRFCAPLLGFSVSGKPDAEKLAKRRAFENRLNGKVSMLRFEFTVELTRTKAQEDMKIGMQVKCPPPDITGGLEVDDILPDGLMFARNKGVDKMKHAVVTPADRLISVNGETSAVQMMAELSKVSTGKTSLRFSRESSRAAPLVWTVDLERAKDEPWGMAISEIAESQNSKELTVSRVIASSPVDKSNKRAARKKEAGVYPGDIIVACDPEVDVKKILTKLQKGNAVQLTMLRWQAAQNSDESAKGDGSKQLSKENSSAAPMKSQNEKDTAEAIDLQATAKSADGASQEKPHSEPEVEQKRCACCGSTITDKFVVMCCAAREIKYFRRTCWRQKHGGFTTKHMPRHCTCGRPLTKVEVFERSSQNSEPRLVHTILDGPMEEDIKFADAPDHEDRPSGAHRRAASASRRAVEGDARRRATSTGRRRVQLGQEDGEIQDGERPAFFLPRRQPNNGDNQAGELPRRQPNNGDNQAGEAAKQEKKDGEGQDGERPAFFQPRRHSNSGENQAGEFVRQESKASSSAASSSDVPHPEETRRHPDASVAIKSAASVSVASEGKSSSQPQITAKPSLTDACASQLKKNPPSSAKAADNQTEKPAESKATADNERKQDTSLKKDPCFEADPWAESSHAAHRGPQKDPWFTRKDADPWAHASGPWKGPSSKHDVQGNASSWSDAQANASSWSDAQANASSWSGWPDADPWARRASSSMKRASSKHDEQCTASSWSDARPRSPQGRNRNVTTQNPKQKHDGRNSSRGASRSHDTATNPACRSANREDCLDEPATSNMILSVADLIPACAASQEGTVDECFESSMNPFAKEFVPARDPFVLPTVLSLSSPTPCSASSDSAVDNIIDKVFPEQPLQPSQPPTAAVSIIDKVFPEWPLQPSLPPTADVSIIDRTFTEQLLQPPPPPPAAVDEEEECIVEEEFIPPPGLPQPGSMPASSSGVPAPPGLFLSAAAAWLACSPPGLDEVPHQSTPNEAADPPIDVNREILPSPPGLSAENAIHEKVDFTAPPGLPSPFADPSGLGQRETKQDQEVGTTETEVRVTRRWGQNRQTAND